MKKRPIIKSHTIKSALSIATSVLLGASCSSEESSNVTNSPDALIGTWHSDKCVGTAGSGGGTYTSASGVTSPIDVVGDVSKHDVFVFGNNGMLTVSEQNFEDSISCNPDLATNVTLLSSTPYTLSATLSATDGKEAVEIDYTRNNTNIFTIYRGHDSTALFFGGRDASSGSNRDGSSDALRHDGINYSIIYTKQ